MSAILEATRRLVGERGSDAVSVREIAAAAGIPVASVYQYFPDKNAILRQLIVGYLDVLRAELAGALSHVRTASELAAAAEKVIDMLVELFRREPALGAIWSAVQANHVLRELDVRDASEMAEFLGAFFLHVLGDTADPEEVRAACYYAVWAAPTVVRAAELTSPIESARLLREQKTLLRLRIETLSRRRGD